MVAVRLAPAVSQLYRRAQRLFQLPSSLPRGSVNEPLEAVAPLMVTFRLMRFASYPLDRGCGSNRRRERTSGSSSSEEQEEEEEEGQSSLFPTRLAFLQWEAAVELQAMIEKAILPPLHLLEEVVAPFAHSEMLSLFDPRPHSLIDLVREDFAPMLQREEKDTVAKVEEQEVVAVLGLLALVSSLTTLPMKESHPLEDAATILARLVHTFGNEVEKAPRKQYSLAVACFELLLLLRLRPHRRGKFYQRLVVDYNHLGQAQLVVSTLRRGLDDPLLMSHSSDRVDGSQDDRTCIEATGGRVEGESIFLAVMQQVAAAAGGGGGDGGGELLLPLAVVLLREVVRHYLPKRRCGLVLKPRVSSVSPLRCAGWACARCTFYHNTCSTTTSGTSSVVKVCLMCGEQLIADRVRWLRESTHTSLLAEIGRLYRLYHEVNCAIVNWGVAALPVLQLTARCIGGPGLGLLCYALARDYEQFRAGAPDLLLLRVQRKDKSMDSVEASEGREENDNRDDSWEDSSWQTVPLEELLGPNWSTASLRDRQNKNEEEEENWMLSAPSLKRSRTDMLSIDGNTKKKKSKQENAVEGEGEESDDTEDENTSPDDEAKHAEDSIVDLDLSPLYNRDGCEWDEKTVRFECLCVEVKGPGDRLSPKQLVWLQLLDIAGPLLQSFLCLVEEE
eukprot:gene6820-7533_t